MSKGRELKEKQVTKITNQFQNSKSSFIFEYLGLNVLELTKLRNELRDEGVEMKIYKNRLAKIAAKNAGFEFEENIFVGPNAFAFSSDDEISAARIIGEHAKTLKMLKFKAGVFEGKVVDIEVITKLSQIPSKDTLLTQIASGLLQPLQKLALGLTMLEESQVASGDKKSKTDLKSKVETKANGLDENVKSDGKTTLTKESQESSTQTNEKLKVKTNPTKETKETSSKEDTKLENNTSLAKENLEKNQAKKSKTEESNKKENLKDKEGK